MVEESLYSLTLYSLTLYRVGSLYSLTQPNPDPLQPNPNPNL